MSTTEQIEIVIPSSEEHRKEILNAIKEMSNAMTRMDGEKDFIKETKKFIKETYDIDSKWLNKALKDYHEDRFEQTQKEYEEYEAFYETIVNMKNNATSTDDDEDFQDES